MKKLLIILAVGLLFSCNSNKSSENSESVSPDSTSMNTQPSASENSGTYMDTTASSGITTVDAANTSRTDSLSTPKRDSGRTR